MTVGKAAMIFQVHNDSPQPLYQQVIDCIDRMIRDKHWPPGCKIPSENALVRDLKVSRMTVNRALRDLTRRGLLHRVQGVGSFVTEPPRHASLIELNNIADEIRSSGHRYKARIISQIIEPINFRLAEEMGLKAGQDVFHLRLVHMGNELPIQLEYRYVNPDLVPDFMAQDFTAITPNEYLLNTLPADEIEHVIQAILPDHETAEFLSIQSNEPCLRMLRRTWSGQSVVSQATLIYPSSREDLSARYKTRGREFTITPHFSLA